METGRHVAHWLLGGGPLATLALRGRRLATLSKWLFNSEFLKRVCWVVDYILKSDKLGLGKRNFIVEIAEIAEVRREFFVWWLYFSEKLCVFGGFALRLNLD